MRATATVKGCEEKDILPWNANAKRHLNYTDTINKNAIIWIYTSSNRLIASHSVSAMYIGGRVDELSRRGKTAESIILKNYQNYTAIMANDDLWIPSNCASFRKNECELVPYVAHISILDGIWLIELVREQQQLRLAMHNSFFLLECNINFLWNEHNFLQRVENVSKQMKITIWLGFYFSTKLKCSCFAVVLLIGSKKKKCEFNSKLQVIWIQIEIWKVSFYSLILIFHNWH